MGKVKFNKFKGSNISSIVDFIYEYQLKHNIGDSLDAKEYKKFLEEGLAEFLQQKEIQKY